MESMAVNPPKYNESKKHPPNPVPSTIPIVKPLKTMVAYVEAMACLFGKSPL